MLEWPGFTKIFYAYGEWKMIDDIATLYKHNNSYLILIFNPDQYDWCFIFMEKFN